MLRIPSAGTPVTCFDLLKGLTCTGASIEAFEEDLEIFLSAKCCQVTGSGTSALYAILLALKGMSDRHEVLLPAYTAPSLILPIRKAGLNPVLCEVSTETLNTGSDVFLDRVNSNTLAVMPVHMFGLATDVARLTEKLEGTGTYCIEDACSAMGTEIGGHQAATLGDVGFISFNRGKNLSTLSGGAVVTNRKDLAEAIIPHLDGYPIPGVKRRLRNHVFASALALAVKPGGYTLLHSLVSKFKYTELHTDFETWSYTGFQAGLGRALLKKAVSIFDKRKCNGRTLIRQLDSVKGVQLPDLLEGSNPVYNQFPILLPDEDTRARAHRAIVETGLESTLLYPDPIHRIYGEFREASGVDSYPEATDISKRLLLFPVHPLVPEPRLECATDALKSALEQA
jgi:perosamine synthetase